MINILLAYSDTDTKLGPYFVKCIEDLKAFLPSCRQEFQIEEIHGAQLNDEYLETVVEKYRPQQFIFAAYSHGNELFLRHGSNDYIIVYENTHLFSNSLFYSNACLTGKRLGPDLINKGCLGFIGYSDAVYSSLLFEIFCQCDNYGIKKFLEGERLGTAYQQMKNNYTEQIDKIYAANAVLASLLRHSRDVLILLGDSDLTIEHFISEHTVI